MNNRKLLIQQYVHVHVHMLSVHSYIQCTVKGQYTHVHVQVVQCIH